MFEALDGYKKTCDFYGRVVDEEATARAKGAKLLATTTLLEGNMAQAFKMRTAVNVKDIKEVIKKQEVKMMAAGGKTDDIQPAILREMERIKKIRLLCATRR